MAVMSSIFPEVRQPGKWVGQTIARNRTFCKRQQPSISSSLAKFVPPTLWIFMAMILAWEKKLWPMVRFQGVTKGL